jgi:CheY-like chemotaxis protein
MAGKVLLVDDSPLVRRAIATRARALGLAFVEHDSVAAALIEPLAELACALLDLELPDGDGVTVAEHLRDRAPHVAIAFFSAGAPNETLTRAQAHGRVFKKPDELDDVLAWLVAHTLR